MKSEQVMINGKWPLWLAPHRAARPEWRWWEFVRLEEMAKTIEPGMVVWDIGAEEGDLPALYATWGADLVLVEPNPLVWPNIRYHWQHNKLDPPLGWFVGLCSDTIDFHPPDLDFDVEEADDGWPVVAHGPVIGDHGFRHLADGQATTPTTTIDNLVTANVAPDVITIDVEGGEFHVLRGASHVLDSFRPVVFVSVHPQFMIQMYGEDPNDLDGYMRDLGYSGELLAIDHEDHWCYRP